MFADRAAEEEKIERQQAAAKKEKKKQNALIGIKKKYGKNAILRGFDYEEGATSRERNAQVGGHKA